MNEVVDHNNEEEAREFQELTQYLFAPFAGENGAGGMIGASREKVRRKAASSSDRDGGVAFGVRAFGFADSDSLTT